MVFSRLGKQRFGSKYKKWLSYLDKYALGVASLALLRLRSKANTIWHIIDHGNAPYAAILPRERTVITCHDCIAIDEALTGRTGEKVGRFGLLLQNAIRHHLSRVAIVAAVSKATLDDLNRLVTATATRRVVVLNGLLFPFSPLSRPHAEAALAGTRIRTDAPFLFTIGSNLKRKNRSGAIASFEWLKQHRLDQTLRLIIAGEPWSDELRARIMQSPYANDIVEAGSISNNELQAAYSLAAAVIFPSLAEGFGLPVIEAQACGATVVINDIAPLREVGSDGVFWADAQDPAKFGACIAAALDDNSGLEAKALANAKRFDTAEWAAQYSRLYASLV